MRIERSRETEVGIGEGVEIEDRGEDREVVIEVGTEGPEGGLGPGKGGDRAIEEGRDLETENG